jgi:3-hydroxyisobutyrate dehydrogenase-like beta-hydroxyacid dehydrogenase
MPDFPATGFIGLGTMGQPMALNLRRAGVPLTVFNRTTARIGPLAEAGARVAETPAAVARQSQVVFLNLADDAALDAVLSGAEGLLAGMAPGGVVVDMGTTSIAATRRFAEALDQRGATWVDAPVSGGEAGARAGTLSIVVGAPRNVFESLLPLFQVLGQNIVHVGESGAGQVAKACNQILVSATLMGVAEAFTFARREGVDPARVRQALLGGFAYSRILEVHGQRMLEDNFVPGFKARLHLKDLNLVADQAGAQGLTLAVAEAARQCMAALVAGGEGELDSSALIHVVHAMSLKDETMAPLGSTLEAQ